MEIKETKFKAGMYLLETLTAGMYNEPMAIYREFIQNSVDSFDIIKELGRQGPRLVKIDIEPFKGIVTIYDNGTGISAKSAEKIFSSIGSSDKRNANQRGFRGIGRLGGIAFCEKAIFRTKYKGEKIESVQEWNCSELRQHLANFELRDIDLKSIFELTTNFYQINGKNEEGSYFQVELQDVSSFRNHILDLKKIERYLQSVAPLPFHPNFLYANEVRSFIKETIPNFGEYTIRLNGENVYKPYGCLLTTSKKNWDTLIGIKTFGIKSGKEILAYGWYGKRNELIGSIRSNNGISGLRVRAGNITIGDEHLLDSCFRESRFNSYMTGEIHIVSQELIPNSRRDDFVDNDAKTKFYDEVEREIGIPMSKEIRLQSNLRSKRTERQNQEKEEVDSGSTNLKIAKDIIIKPANKPSLDIRSRFNSDQVLKEIFEVCGNCGKLIQIKNKYKI